MGCMQIGPLAGKQRQTADDARAMDDVRAASHARSVGRAAIGRAD